MVHATSGLDGGEGFPVATPLDQQVFGVIQGDGRSRLLKIISRRPLISWRAIYAWRR